MLKKIVRFVYYLLWQNTFLRRVLKKISSAYIGFKYRKVFAIAIEKAVNNNLIVKVSLDDNLAGKSLLASRLTKIFGSIVNVNGIDVYRRPAAIIEIPKCMDEYYKLIGDKSRNMLRKCKKEGFIFDHFVWNDRLDDIFKINVSKPVRQGRIMDRAYREYPKKCNYCGEPFKVLHIGAWRGQVVVGYIELYVFGNFAMINRILGHSDFLKYGIMNGLIENLVLYGLNSGEYVYINYLDMVNYQHNTLASFKFRVGFREYAIARVL